MSACFWWWRLRPQWQQRWQSLQEQSTKDDTEDQLQNAQCQCEHKWYINLLWKRKAQNINIQPTEVQKFFDWSRFHYHCDVNASEHCTPSIAGQYNDGTGIRNCSIGTYQDERGQTSCKPCPPGKYGRAVVKDLRTSIAKSCIDCPKGKYSHDQRRYYKSM